MTIAKIRALEILDSRGNPTLMTKVTLSDGTCGVAKVPSGASTGIHEAVELRDGGDRYGGKGVAQAVENVNTVLAEVMTAVNPLVQKEVDETLLKTDPSKGKGKLEPMQFYQFLWLLWWQQLHISRWTYLNT